ncbi:MAG: DUF4127 family protein [Coprobacillaceae bacterium]
MKTLFIPLDERPCNTNFVEMIADSNEKVTLLSPDKSILGDKKTPANIDKVMQFIAKHSQEVDNIVLSLDMLLYGGLIPSRLHHLTKEEVYQRMEYLSQIKKLNAKVKIYAFNCIMRAPSYDSSEEEPDYYEQYGYALFRRKYLLDSKNRSGINEDEEKELKNISIPQDIIDDYEWRRDFNTDINMKVVSYVESGVIDFLVIPQDDSSPYGYTAISQKKVVDYVREHQLEQKVMIYPGADEVAMSLLARAYNEYHDQTISIYPLYSSILGPQIVPKYEDRPMFESLKSHIRVVGGKIATTPKEADFILAINSPGKFMQESFEPKDITYTSYRQLLDFSLTIEEYINEGYHVAVCDSAFSNGGDTQLISYLDQRNVLDKVIAYAGWNTNCNTLGTVLSQSVLGQQSDKIRYHVIYRILEDVFYQANSRLDIIENVLPKHQLSYYDFKDKQSLVEETIAKKLIEQYNELKISKTYPVQSLQIYMPWKRMFEIGMNLKIERL